jgi:hypothetical protein
MTTDYVDDMKYMMRMNVCVVNLKYKLTMCLHIFYLIGIKRFRTFSIRSCNRICFLDMCIRSCRIFVWTLLPDQLFLTLFFEFVLLCFNLFCFCVFLLFVGLVCSIEPTISRN